MYDDNVCYHWYSQQLHYSNIIILRNCWFHFECKHHIYTLHLHTHTHARIHTHIQMFTLMPTGQKSNVVFSRIFFKFSNRTENRLRIVTIFFSRFLGDFKTAVSSSSSLVTPADETGTF